MSSSRQIKNLVKDSPLFNFEHSLKKDGKIVKDYFYNFISNHTARRTFIHRGVMANIPISVMMQFVWHSSPYMLLHYCQKIGKNDNERFIKLL